METKKTGMVYKILSTVSIVGLFLTVGILITGLVQGYLNALTALILAIFTILFAGCMLSLVWINNIQNQRYKKTSIAFLAFTILCCILWIVAVILVYIMAKNTTTAPVGALRFVQAAVIASIQFVVANIIARNIIKHQKSHIAFQIIMYISCLFIDFYVTMFAIGINFTPADGIKLSESIRSFLFSGGMIVTLILFVVYIAVANSILNQVEAKKNGGRRKTSSRRGLLGSLVDNLEQGVFDEISHHVSEAHEEPVEAEKTEESAQERLTKIKKLYEDGLITEEEFNAKKKEILEDV